MRNPADITLMNTAPIRAAAARMLAAVLAFVDGGAALRAKTARIARLTKLYRLLLLMERYNADKILKFQMLSNPVWRARVYADLGGWFGARRWEERRITTARNRAAPPKHAQTLTAGQCRAMPSPRYITDSAGQFRWAPIDRKPRERDIARDYEAPHGMTAAYTALKPIALYPLDFEKAETAANERAAQSGAPPQIKFNGVEPKHQDQKPDVSPQGKDPPPQISLRCKCPLRIRAREQ